MKALIITAIICVTVVALAFIGNNKKGGKT